MSAVTINGLNINDNTNYIVEEVTFRGAAEREVGSTGIARQPGAALTATEWKTKDIQIKGIVFGSSASDLRTRIDTFQQNAGVQSLALLIDTDRTYTATLTKLDIPTQFYNSSYARYTASFKAVDPFAYGSLLTASGTTISGTVTYSGTLTISGTVFAAPALTLNPTGARAGDSGLKTVKITHVPTGETMTISGMINYTSDLIIDYKNYLVTNSGVNSDYTGIFSRFQPGTVSYTITVISGANQGYNYKWSYRPRYYQ